MLFAIYVYYQDDQIKEEKIGRACSTRGRNEKCTNNFEERKQREPFRRLKHKWEDNIKMDLRDMF
jgi:hypothetical protein